MEINYNNISSYLRLFDLLQDIGGLPEYHNISIIVNDDHSTILYFNATEIISYKKLRRIIFKKHTYKVVPERYPEEVFNKLSNILSTDILNKYDLWKDDINYNTGRLMIDNNEKYKLAKIFYISYETPVSENINKVNMVHFMTLFDEFLLNPLNNLQEEIEYFKNTYMKNTELIKLNVENYNKNIRKIKRLRKKIKEVEKSKKLIT